MLPFTRPNAGGRRLPLTRAGYFSRDGGAEGVHVGSSRSERLEVIRTLGKPGVVVIALYGELDMVTTPKLTRATIQVLAADPRPEVLVLDLSGLSFLSVAGVRAMHTAHDAAGDTRLRVVIGERRAVCEFLHTIGSDAVLDCYRTRIDAIAAGTRAEFVSHARAAWNED
jgi:anti-sigma B factor antagonist